MLPSPALALALALISPSVSNNSSWLAHWFCFLIIHCVPLHIWTHFLSSSESLHSNHLSNIHLLMIFIDFKCR